MKPYFYLLILLFGIPAHSAEIYPNALGFRLFGTNQGVFGDCQTEAQIHAMENAFLSRGIAVRLSLFYTHAATWADKKPEVQKSVGLKINDADQRLIARAGKIIPEYMWPEDSNGINQDQMLNTTIRPHVSDAVVWDEEFPSTSAFGYSEEFKTFQKGWRNSSNFDELRAQVAARNAVTVSIHSSILYLPWNKKTGLLQKKYKWDDLLKYLSKDSKVEDQVTHALAVVGFDDSLYADGGYTHPGAFIVRNSWNDASEIRAINEPPTKDDLLSIKSMRLKIGTENLPGFYAIPYDYFYDLMSQQSSDGKIGMGGFRVYNLNYVQYGKYYDRFQNRYEEITVPYVCDGISPWQDFPDSMDARNSLTQFMISLETIKNSPNKNDRIAAKNFVENFAYIQSVNRVLLTYSDDSPKFSYAKLSRTKDKKTDRIADFYSGKFSQYYCNLYSVSDNTKVWPYLKHYQNPVYEKALVSMAKNGSDYKSWIKTLRVLGEMKVQDDFEP
jgi:hypothetical protein